MTVSSIGRAVFDNMLHIIGLVVAALIFFGLMIGFWRGLSLRPHRPDNQPRPPSIWWFRGL